MTATPPVILIDGSAATTAGLAHLALVNHGHFTAMQVRDGATRGLDRHLLRLTAAHAELYGSEVDADLARDRMRVAVADHPDCYLRVTLYEEQPGDVRIMTVVRPPVEATDAPQALLPVPYVRPFAHIKHVGAFAQIRYGEQAESAGFDDALFVGPDGRLSETTIANVGFLDADRVVWPDGAALHGITWQLLDEQLAREGRPARTAPITLESATRITGAFIANSIGVSPVSRIGAHEFAPAPRAVAELAHLYEAVAWDRL